MHYFDRLTIKQNNNRATFGKPHSWVAWISKNVVMDRPKARYRKGQYDTRKTFWSERFEVSKLLVCVKDKFIFVLRVGWPLAISNTETCVVASIVLNLGVSEK